MSSVNERVKQDYINAYQRLAGDGYVSLTALMLAVPVQRQGKDPLPRKITSDYRTPSRPNHNGVDWNGGSWAKGYHPYLNFLVGGAKVTRADKNAGSYGNVIDITAKVQCKVKGKTKMSNLMIRRAHCHELLTKKGQTLDLWQAYATLGTTGNSTGPHEHQEVWIDGVRVNPHDVELWVPFLSAEQQTYIVQPGDTYYKISQMFGVPVADLKRWNGWPDKAIPKYATMWLVEPPKDTPEPEPPVRDDSDPPHPMVTPEEFEQLLEDHEALQGRVKALEDKIAAIGNACR